MEDKKEILSIFENTNYTYQRKETQSIILDVECGTTITFNETLDEPLIIDKPSDVYLDALTTFRCKTTDSEGEMGFLLRIDDFPIKTVSNNSSANRALFIPNEQTTDGNPSKGKTHKGKKLNYICSINPQKITKLSGKLTLINGSTTPFSGDDGRFILDLSIIPR
tara:strand:+ start:108 stop:602 length:495 start_codon:yes stop_codon:yes gene_type:complete